MVAGEVVIVYRKRGLAVEVENIRRRGGIINNAIGCNRMDTYFGGCNVSASTLCIQGMWVGNK